MTPPRQASSEACSEASPENRPEVYGIAIDPQTRCKHWHGPLDILAIKFRCCNNYYSCYECHAALAGHAAQVWPAAEFDTPALLCGACGADHSVTAYLKCDSTCPACGAAFNPRCSLHHHLYFERPAAG